MTLTRANVESILVNRCGAYMEAVGMVVTIVGTNANLNDPIGYAIRACDGSVADYVLVTNADILTVDSDDYDKLFDVAELRTLESVSGNYDMVDITVGPRSEKLNQLAQNLEARLKRLAQQVEDKYGIGAPTVDSGHITLDFADHNEALPT